MVKTVRAVERLKLCCEACEGLLTRLCDLRDRSVNKPAKALVDKRAKKLYEFFVKAMPDYPKVDTSDKALMQTQNELQPSHRMFCEELEADYLTLLDTMEFIEEAFLVLRDVASAFEEQDIERFTIENVPDVFASFMNLVVGYIRIYFMTSLVEKAKTIACAYAYSYQMTNTTESYFKKLSEFLLKSAHPILSVQGDIKEIAPFIAKILSSLKMLYPTLLNFDEHKRVGTLSVLAHMDELQYPARKPIYTQLPLLAEMTSWMQWGLLLCPKQLALMADLQELCRMSLSESAVLPIFRKETVEIQELYHHVFTDAEYREIHEPNPKDELKKIKSAVLKRAVSNLAVSAAMVHMQRRVYLQHELKTIIALLEDCPGLLAPKIQLIFCLLSLARNEVLWFTLHSGVSLKGRVFKKVSISLPDAEKAGVGRLISSVDTVVALLRQHREVVKDYYQLYLSGNDKNAMTAALQEIASSDAGLSSLLTDTRDNGASANPELLPIFRLEWLRGQFGLISTRWNLGYEATLTAFNRAAAHSLFVDALEEEIQRHASMQELFWRDDVFESIFINALESSADSCGSLIRVCGDFILCVHSYLPEEQEIIGQATVDFAKRLLKRAAEYAFTSLSSIQTSFTLKLDTQVKHVNAYRAAKNKKLEESGRGRINVASPDELPPGVESDPYYRHVINHIFLKQFSLKQLCFGFSTVGRVVLYNIELVPLEFIKHAFLQLFRTVVPQAWGKDQSEMERPSTAFTTIESYIGALCSIQSYADFDAASLAEKILLEEFTHPSAGPVGGKFIDSKPPASPNSIITFVCDKYVNVLTERASSVLFSPVRRSFIPVKSTGLLANIEEFTDPNGLFDLVRTIGSAGVRALDQRLLFTIKERVLAVKEIIMKNYAPFKALQANYHSDAGIDAAVKPLTGAADALLTALSSMGVLLTFRRLLHDALGEVLSSRAPGIASILQEFSSATGSGEIRMSSAFSADLLAHDAGVLNREADPGFHGCIASFMTDRNAGEWLDLLPFAFACVYAAPAWKEIEYNPALGLFTANAHCVVTAIIALTLGTKAYVNEKDLPEKDRPAGQADKERLVRLSLVETTRVSSAVILRQNRVSKELLRNLFILLEKFVLSANRIVPSLWNYCVPYALIQASYVDLFKKSKGLALTQEDQDVDASHS